MKKLLLLPTLVLMGCESASTPKEERKEYSGDVSHITYKKHKYILFKMYQRLGTVHDPECPCHKHIDKHNMDNTNTTNYDHNNIRIRM